MSVMRLLRVGQESLLEPHLDRAIAAGPAVQRLVGVDLLPLLAQREGGLDVGTQLIGSPEVAADSHTAVLAHQLEQPARRGRSALPVREDVTEISISILKCKGHVLIEGKAVGEAAICKWVHGESITPRKPTSSPTPSSWRAIS